MLPKLRLGKTAELINVYPAKPRDPVAVALLEVEDGVAFILVGMAQPTAGAASRSLSTMPMSTVIVPIVLTPSAL